MNIYGPWFLYTTVFSFVNNVVILLAAPSRNPPKGFVTRVCPQEIRQRTTRWIEGISESTQNQSSIDNKWFRRPVSRPRNDPTIMDPQNHENSFVCAWKPPDLKLDSTMATRSSDSCFSFTLWKGCGRDASFSGFPSGYPTPQTCSHPGYRVCR